MQRKEIFSYVKKTYQIVPDQPFDDDFDTSVLRHADTRKWFALVMQVRADRLGYNQEEMVDILTLKSEPMLIDSLVLREGFHRAYHMNKSQWVSIELNEKVGAKEVKGLIDLSYELTQRKSKKKKKE